MKTKLSGLRSSWNHTEWTTVILESDSLLAVQAIRSKIPMSSPFGLIVEDCRILLKRLNKISLYFVRRSANMAAHCMAKASYSFPDRVFNGGNVPVDVKNVVLADLI